MAVAEAVVDQLEPIEIEEEDCYRIGGPRGPNQRVLEAIGEEDSIG